MAESDSEQFESADEDFFDIEPPTGVAESKNSESEVSVETSLTEGISPVPKKPNLVAQNMTNEPTNLSTPQKENQAIPSEFFSDDSETKNIGAALALKTSELAISNSEPADFSSVSIPQLNLNTTGTDAGDSKSSSSNNIEDTSSTFLPENSKIEKFKTCDVDDSESTLQEMYSENSVLEKLNPQNDMKIDKNFKSIESFENTSQNFLPKYCKSNNGIPSEPSVPSTQSNIKIVDFDIKPTTEIENSTNLSDEVEWTEGWDTEEIDFTSNESVETPSKIVPCSEKTKVAENSENDAWDTEDFEFDDISVSANNSGKATDKVSNISISKSTATNQNLKCSKDLSGKHFNKDESTDNQVKEPIRAAPNFDEVEETKKTYEDQEGWFGWGTNFLSSATEGLSTITTNVSSVFESTIGVPEPEEMVRIHKELALKQNPTKDGIAKEPEEEDGGLTNNLFSVSSWTKFVESTGTKVLSSGLGTLETIGKKTMEVLQEGDPGLKKKRAKLRQLVSEGEKPVLSQILREAKEKAEASSHKGEDALIASKVNFEILFDDFEGLVHLEALEMISKQCQIKLDSLSLKYSGDELTSFKETLEQVEELCELPSDEETDLKESIRDNKEFILKIKESLADLEIEIQYDKLSKTAEIVEKRLEENLTSLHDLHRVTISSIAEISAAAMQIFHRVAEMLVIKSKHNTINEAVSLMSFGKIICLKLDSTAELFSEKLKTIDSSGASIVNHVFKEAANSVSYVQNACQLLVPILQQGAVV